MFNKIVGRFMYNESKRHVQSGASIQTDSTIFARASASFNGGAEIVSQSIVVVRGAVTRDGEVVIIGPGAIHMRATGVRAGDIEMRAAAQLMAVGTRSPVVEMLLTSKTFIVADGRVFRWEKWTAPGDHWERVPDVDPIWTEVDPTHTDWRKVRA